MAYGGGYTSRCAAEQHAARCSSARAAQRTRAWRRAQRFLQALPRPLRHDRQRRGRSLADLRTAVATARPTPLAPRPRSRLARRGGLNARQQPSDQLQINIGPQFNYESQLQGLRDDVKKMKQVRPR